MKNITKTTQTILFAVLITAMILPFSGMMAEAAVGTSNENTNDKVKDKTQKEKNKAAHQKLVKDINDKKFRENIPLVLSYLDEDGKVITIVDKNSKKSKQIYEKRIKDHVGHDVEIKVNKGYFQRETCTSLTANCDPLYGGIKISTDAGYSTLTIGATNNNGVKGFVTSSHGVGSGTSQDISQPEGILYKVGDVITNPSLDGRSSDAAFVDLSSNEDTTNKIYRTSTTHYTVTGTSDPGYNTRVQKTGYTSGETDGYVIGTALTVYDDKWGQLIDQTAANYLSLDGDSGAPVYTYSTSANNVELYGIHVGYACLIDSNPCPSNLKIKVFSPWNNVVSELNLVTTP